MCNGDFRAFRISVASGTRIGVHYEGCQYREMIGTSNIAALHPDGLHCAAPQYMVNLKEEAVAIICAHVP